MMESSSSALNYIPLQVRLIQAVHFLLQKKWIIIIAGIAGGVLGFLYCSTKRPYYTAISTFSLENDNNIQGAGNLLSLASQFGFDAGSTSGVFNGDNIEELFKSRRMIENTMLQPYKNTQVSFADTFLNISNLRKSNLPNPLFSINPHTIQFTRVQDSIMYKLSDLLVKDLLDVDRPDKKLDIYEVTFKSHNEEFSKLFTEKLIEQVSDFYITTKTKKAKQNVEILEHRTDSIRNLYNAALYGKASIMDANMNSAFQMPMVNAQKKQTDITVLATAYGELLKNLEIAKYSLLRQTPLLQVIDEPRYPLKKKTYSKIIYTGFGFIFFSFLSICFLLFLRLMIAFKKLLASA